MELKKMYLDELDKVEKAGRAANCSDLEIRMNLSVMRFLFKKHQAGKLTDEDLLEFTNDGDAMLKEFRILEGGKLLSKF